MAWMFVSCSTEEVNFVESNAFLSQATDSILIDKITVLDGRLYFPNIATFQNFYNKNFNEDEDVVVDVLESKFYSKGFYSLKPLVNSKNEYQLARHIDKFKELNIATNSQTRSINSSPKSFTPTSEDIVENFDDVEDILGEEVFESFLNQNAEIQVGEIVYKYTDQGLFLAPAVEVNGIYSFMEENGVHSLSDVGSIEPLTSYPEYNTSGGLVTLTKDLQHYIAPVEDDVEIRDYIVVGDSGVSSGGGTSGGSTGGSGTTSSQTTTNDIDFQNATNNLTSCSGSNPFIGNLFGKTKVCIDNYESKRRVKVKYYNIDFFLAYAIGVKVKHQFKGWTGFWRKESTDEVAMGINSVTWRFDHYKNFPSMTDTPIRYFLDDGRVFSDSKTFYNAKYAGNIPIPNLPFGKTLDILVDVLLYNDVYQFKNEEEVRKFFYSNIFKQAESLLKQERNKQLKRIGLVVNTRQQTFVQYYDFTSRCANCSKIETVFDWGIGTPKITYSFGNGQGFDWNKSLDFTFLMDFSHPDATNLNVFGMAKRNNIWYGRKMVF
ncbi:MAG: hypothetical protein U1C58_08245 [Flavobacteriaceae bacterium]|nr:hypothetical protein [Flavobacteriaceae bacterium]